jgi:hypothetical protein
MIIFLKRKFRGEIYKCSLCGETSTDPRDLCLPREVREP